MPLAVSSIAWPHDAEPAVAHRLAALGVQGVEVAPTKLWPRPTEAPAAEVDAYREWWAACGVPIVAMQALLFGRDDLAIFGDRAVRDETLDYLRRMIDLAGRLGARRMVFGSPRNRRVGDLPAAEAERIAVPFFRAAGEAADDAGVVLCIEPNPPQYACDWVNTAAEAAALAALVDRPGFGVHLDAAAITLNGEDAAAAVAAARPWLRHFHASEPFLAPLASPGGDQPRADHAGIAAALAGAGYDGWVSIEMRAVDAPAPGEHVAAAVAAARAAYGALAR